jgi:site-specific recombinase XerD
MKKIPLLREIQLFLTKYCQQERRLGRETILSYRDVFKLLIIFYRDQMQCPPAKLGIESLSYDATTQFLDHLEKKRGASVSTRNQRLCAIKSFCRYLLFRHPDYADTISRCLNVPMKKRSNKNRPFLEKSEVTALLNSMDQTTWTGRRDQMMFDLAIRTGLRVSELIALRPESFTFSKSPYVTVDGKGRKERSVPLDRPFARSISQWIASDLRGSTQFIFPTRSGSKLSADAVQRSLRVTCAGGGKEDSFITKKEDLAPYSATYNGNATSRSWCGYSNHRPMARPRTN